jgi:hypothetical protein
MSLQFLTVITEQVDSFLTRCNSVSVLFVSADVKLMSGLGL